MQRLSFITGQSLDVTVHHHDVNKHHARVRSKEQTHVVCRSFLAVVGLLLYELDIAVLSFYPLSAQSISNERPIERPRVSDDPRFIYEITGTERFSMKTGVALCPKKSSSDFNFD
jgi:hypothetical protein